MNERIQAAQLERGHGREASGRRGQKGRHIGEVDWGSQQKTEQQTRRRPPPLTLQSFSSRHAHPNSPIPPCKTPPSSPLPPTSSSPLSSIISSCRFPRSHPASKFIFLKKKIWNKLILLLLAIDTTTHASYLDYAPASCISNFDYLCVWTNTSQTPTYQTNTNASLFFSLCLDRPSLC